MTSSSRQRRLLRLWDRHADTYDRQMSGIERRFFRDTRAWIAGQATGDTLEVAIGTGLNLPYYPAGVRLTGIEWSPAMLRIARRRAADLGREVELHTGDAQALDFPDARFDTVACTFALCAIPDARAALAEMARVLRPGGLLLLADHVASPVWPVRALQAVVDAVTVPLQGEHFGRRPLPWAVELGFTVERRDRFNLGIIERFAARAPGTSDT
ncbi:class I SAM-dependent methyltransferase [Dactylosporangium roseum]